MSPIIKLDETMTPTHVFVAMTRSKRSSKCLIEPSARFDFGVFGRGVPLNPKNELLLAHLRGDTDIAEQLQEYHNSANAKKHKADAERVSSTRALAGQSGDRKRKREGGENGEREGKRVGGESGDRERKGGDRSQQQAAGRCAQRAANVEDKRAGSMQQAGARKRYVIRVKTGSDDGDAGTDSNIYIQLCDSSADPRSCAH